MRSARVWVELVDLDGDLWRWPPPTATDRRAAASGHTGAFRRRLDAARVVRGIVAERSGLEADTIVAGRAASGRPQLARTDGRALAMAISTSRRGRWLAVALARRPGVGVDVEVVRRYPGAKELVTSLFPLPARHALAGADGPDFDRHFATWWARIEAAVKAGGGNLDDAAQMVEHCPQSVAPLATPHLALAVAVAGAVPRAQWHVGPDLPPTGLQPDR